MRNEINLMQVLRVPPLGKLMVEINKERYESLANVTNEKLKRALLAAIGELVGFAGGYEVLVEAGVAPPVTSPEPAAAQPQPSLEKQQAAFLAALEAERAALRAPSEPVKPSVLSGLRSSMTPAPQTAEPPSAGLSIVEQIDAILQRRLAADASMAQRSVHLEKDPSGGLRIRVDGTIYQKPAEIKDTKIQIHIRQALKEWESS